jgi:hypothetical protein
MEDICNAIIRRIHDTEHEVFIEVINNISTIHGSFIEVKTCGRTNCHFHKGLANLEPAVFYHRNELAKHGFVDTHTIKEINEEFIELMKWFNEDPKTRNPLRIPKDGIIDLKKIVKLLPKENLMFFKGKTRRLHHRSDIHGILLCLYKFEEMQKEIKEGIKEFIYGGPETIIASYCC